MRTRQTKIIAVVILISALGVWALYRDRIPLLSWFWHLRHANLSVGTYVIPVPKNWYVDNQGQSDQLLVRLDTADQQPVKRLKAHAAVSLHEGRPRSQQQVARTLALDDTWFKNKNITPIEQRTVEADGTEFMCIGGAIEHPTGIFDAEPVSWQCMDTGGLEVTITAPEVDMPQVWQILSGARRVGS